MAMAWRAHCNATEWDEWISQRRTPRFDPSCGACGRHLWTGECLFSFEVHCSQSSSNHRCLQIRLGSALLTRAFHWHLTGCSAVDNNTEVTHDLDCLIFCAWWANFLMHCYRWSRQANPRKHSDSDWCHTWQSAQIIGYRLSFTTLLALLTFNFTSSHNHCNRASSNSCQACKRRRQLWKDISSQHNQSLMKGRLIELFMILKRSILFNTDSVFIIQ